MPEARAATRLFMACLSTETNTFSPVPTGLAGFEAYSLHHGTASRVAPNLMTESLHLWRARAEALGWEVIESLTAIAEPAGRTTARVYRDFKREILADLQAACPVDVILLSLHGAMVADGCDDCEGDLVAAIRARCPEAVIGVSLDLHCHLTEALIAAADLVVTFKEYPHDDATPRAAELWDLALRQHRGDIAPEMALFDCRMMGLYLTKAGPMAAFVARMQAAEGQGGVLSVSLGHGFPWADVADVGARMLVIADGDRALAVETAERLGRAFFAMREGVTRSYPGLTDALSRVRDTAPGEQRPIVLADMSDNSGAGAPGDATFVLQAVLEAGIRDVALGLIFDPGAVAICRDAGIGTRLTLRVGGKIEVASGRPLDVTGEIRAIRSDCGQHLGPGLEPMGSAVWIALDDGVDLVLNDLRVQVYHPEAFTQLGITLETKRLIVVKSLFHFYTPFAALASDVIFCATPGRVTPDMRALPHTRRLLPYWPKVADPWTANAGD